MKLFAHPQETWTEAECAKRAKYRGTDGRGTKHPYPGLIASSAGAHPEYGQAVRYNGGCIREGELYDGEVIPLPKIPDTYEFFKRPTWGTYIRRKAQ